MKINKQFDELAQGVNVWYPNGYPSAEGGDEEWLNYAIFEKKIYNRSLSRLLPSVLNNSGAKNVMLAI